MPTNYTREKSEREYNNGYHINNLNDCPSFKTSFRRLSDTRQGDTKHIVLCYAIDENLYFCCNSFLMTSLVSKEPILANISVLKFKKQLPY